MAGKCTERARRAHNVVSQTDCEPDMPLTASPTAARPQAAARLKGVLSPVITPFKADLSPDGERFVRHCKWLLKSGCTGLAIFGTNSEANSLSLEEKLTLLAALLHAGVPGSALMPGTGHCALPATVRLTANAVKMGCAGVLMLPPFYYKGVSDEGLYRYFSEVIERVGDERLRVYLYHIPPVSQVGISLKLIGRLLSKYPGIVAGAKDSSGDWSNTKAMLDEFGRSGFDVFPGSELFLLEGMRHGGAGCISATANVNPGPIDQVFRNWRSGEADKLQAGIGATRKIMQQYPMIAALKAVVAHFGNDGEWRRVRPPLVELTAEQEAALIPELKAAGFAMPGLAG
jgi:4-hydroxy-tetrahydrodipicolinate synthase